MSSMVLPRAALALLIACQAACVSQSGGPYGPAQGVGPGGVQQSAGPHGPAQSVGLGGVRQSAGPGGPAQSVGWGGVQQNAGGAPAGQCSVTCGSQTFGAQCAAHEGQPACQCNTRPHATCVKPAQSR